MSGAVPDPHLDHARIIIRDALADLAKSPTVASFFDDQTNTVSHVVSDTQSNACAIIDSVLDYDAASGRTMNRSAEALIEHIRSEKLEVHWLLETHAHADHLSAAPLLQGALDRFTF